MIRGQDGYQFFKVRPLFGLIYIAMLVGLSAYFVHPIMVIVSNLCAFLCCFLACGRKAFLMLLCFCLPILLACLLFGMFFNHDGGTVLFYVNLRPITLEAACFGLINGGIICAVSLWFVLLNYVVGEDGIRRVLSRFFPNIALSLTMSIGQLPRMKKRLFSILDAQKVLGQGVGRKGIFRKLKGARAVTFALLTHSLEGGMDTALALRARGYGGKIKAKGTNERLRGQDVWFAFFVVLLMTLIIILVIFAPLKPVFFPFFSFKIASFFSYFLIVFYSFFCLIPLIFELFWRVRWHLLRLKI